MNLDILYEDQDLLLINKPAGVVVNNALSVKSETVQDYMVAKLGKEQFIGEYWDKHPEYQKLIPSDFDQTFGDAISIWQERLGIVHRLDKDTSGVLLLAKNPGSLVNLLSQFKKRQTQKTYLALVHGHLDEKNGQIIAPMGRSKFNRLKFAIDSEGREATTFYEVKQEFLGLKEEAVLEIAKESKLRDKRVKELYQAGFSLVELMPKTGRTHQIRVHMSAKKHPLVGDQLYVGRKLRKADSFWCQRQFLHAKLLEFTHPRSQEKMQIEAPLTEDLKEVLDLVL